MNSKHQEVFVFVPDEVFRPEARANAEGKPEQCRARTGAGKAGNVARHSSLYGDNDKGKKTEEDIDRRSQEEKIR